MLEIWKSMIVLRHIFWIINLSVVLYTKPQITYNKEEELELNMNHVF